MNEITSAMSIVTYDRYSTKEGLPLAVFILIECKCYISFNSSSTDELEIIAVTVYALFTCLGIILDTQHSLYPLSTPFIIMVTESRNILRRDMKHCVQK